MFLFCFLNKTYFHTTFILTISGWGKKNKYEKL